ncbi:MAG: B12-binding domain-containing radical SAM protein [Candidatus Coatesbacteria bacterium]|nr:B12-binding domain-containing radical SAM protein [Candidatus Coatesbacteria bacterium]
MTSREVKILFVNPGRGIYDMPPLGVCYLTSYLRKHGRDRYSVLLADEYAGHNPVKVAREFEPDIIGFSCATAQYYRATLLAEKIREFSKVPFIIGGLHPTALPERVIEEGFFDIAVISEGERSFTQLVDALSASEFSIDDAGLEKVPGVCFMHHGEIFQTEPPAFIDDLDTIPFPDRSLLDLKHYLRPNAAIRSMITRNTTIMTSRGCPFRCIYCISVHRRQLRKHSPEYVIEETQKLIKDYNLEGLCIIDDTFIFDQERASKIAEMMIEKGISDRLKWPCYGRANIVSKAEDSFIELLKKAGMAQMEFGFESASPRVLEFLKGKGVTPADNLATLDTLERLNVRTLATFLTGVPTETAEEVQTTVDFIRQNFERLAYFEILYLVPYPGTKVWELYHMDEVLAPDLWQNYKIGLNKRFPVDSEFVRSIDYEAATKAVNEVLSMMARKQTLSYNLRFLRDRLRIAPIDTIKKIAGHLFRR